MNKKVVDFLHYQYKVSFFPQQNVFIYLIFLYLVYIKNQTKQTKIRFECIGE